MGWSCLEKDSRYMAYRRWSYCLIYGMTVGYPGQGRRADTVQDLLEPGGNMWNDAKVQVVFLHRDTNGIKPVQVGGPGKEDYVAWNFTKDGRFTVKSAYHVKMQNISMSGNRTGSSSTTCSSHKGWLALWNVDVAQKIKIHIGSLWILITLHIKNQLIWRVQNFPKRKR